VKACPNHAIEIVDGNPTVVSEKCRLDGLCVNACQTGAREMAGKKVTAANIIETVETDTVFYDESGGGVTFSGGEPFMQPVFLKTLLKLCKERRIHTAVETCGFVDSSILLSSVADVDLLLYDLKVMDDERHRRFTGVSNNGILENLRKLSNSQVEIIVRFPVIPGVNDYDSNVSRMGEFVSVLGNVKEIDILPYHELGVEKYKRLGLKHNMPEVQLLSTERLSKIAGELEGFGLRVKVGG
jgi:pyruvate formate lyase activating enzyme